eukprot:TRINITY_DN294_c0_g2_i1.p1 TRINITY_DN294_c0_g2~~TRINITY_DN294_c0_g2_i1.p1  ORF type:complete len:471 (+),score=97.88 TRINITY_DN294_c0_g2_i1:89-1414(+)
MDGRGRKCRQIVVRRENTPQLMFLSSILASLCLTTFLGSAAGFFEGGDVVDLTPATFKSKVLQSDHIWMIMFYAPWCGHCQRLKPDYAKAATATKGIVRFGAINCDEHQSIGSEYGVRGFPTLKLFGTNKKKPTDYQGARTAKGMSDAAIALLPNLVTIVTPKTHDTFLSTQPEFPRVILFTAKSSTTPLYKGLALGFKGRLLLGEVRAGKGKAGDLLERYGVSESKLPALVAIPSGESVSADLPKYDGELKYKPIHTFLSKYANPKPSKDGKASESKKAKAEKKAEKKAPSDEGGKENKTPGASQPATAAPPKKEKVEVPEAKTGEDLQKCFKAPGFCVLGLLDSSLDAAEHEKHVATLTRVATKYQGDPVTFAWLHSPTHTTLVSHFAKGDGPAVVVLNAKRGKYALHDGLENVDTTLDRALGGDLSYTKLPYSWQSDM